MQCSRVTTNCDGNRVESKTCDIIENIFDQDCSQSLLKKQSDEEDLQAEGDDGVDLDEIGKVVEDQLSLEEWGEDDLQVE